MKIRMILFGIWMTLNLHANEFDFQVNEDSIFVEISNLHIGDTIEYSIIPTFCLSGNSNKTMDSIQFMRDGYSIKAIYKDKIYIIESDDLKKINEIETELLNIGISSSTFHYNYTISYPKSQVLVGTGNKDIWEKLINFITDK